MIRLTIPVIEEDDIQAVVNTLKSGFLVQGKQVKQFEEKVAELTGARYAIAVSNCTAALHLSLVALDISAGDLVIVPAYSWLSTANVVELCGATPIFVDVDAETFNLDINALEQQLAELSNVPATQHRIKAVIPVHVFGQLADMEAISDLCQHYQVPVVEDAACALGATYRGKHAGTWGQLGCFSFHPRKALTTGEGGIVLTDDYQLATRIKALRNHGLDPEASSPQFVLAGYNYRMTDIQGALGCTQMQKFSRILDNRRLCAKRYTQLLQGSSITAPMPRDTSEHAFQSYVVLLPEGLQAYRSSLIQQLREQGIETTIGTYHMPMTQHFKTVGSYQVGDFHVADNIAGRALTLPVYEGLSLEDQSFVITTLLNTINHFGA